MTIFESGNADSRDKNKSSSSRTLPPSPLAEPASSCGQAREADGSGGRSPAPLPDAAAAITASATDPSTWDNPSSSLSQHQLQWPGAPIAARPRGAVGADTDSSSSTTPHSLSSLLHQSRPTFSRAATSPYISSSTAASSAASSPLPSPSTSPLSSVLGGRAGSGRHTTVQRSSLSQRASSLSDRSMPIISRSATISAANTGVSTGVKTGHKTGSRTGTGTGRGFGSVCDPLSSIPSILSRLQSGISDDDEPPDFITRKFLPKGNITTNQGSPVSPSSSSSNFSSTARFRERRPSDPVSERSSSGHSSNLDTIADASEATEAVDAAGAAEAISTPLESSHSLPLPLFQLQHTELAELLDHDDRPTFVVDIADGSNFSFGPLKILYANAALRQHGHNDRILHLLQTGGGSLAASLSSSPSFPSSPPSPCSLSSLSSPSSPFSSPSSSLTSSLPATRDEYWKFKDWVLLLVGSKKQQPSSAAPSLSLYSSPFAGLGWTSSTLRQRYRIVRGICTPTKTDASSSAFDMALPPPSLENTASTATATPRMQPDSALDSAPTSPLPQGAILQESDDYFGNASADFIEPMGAFPDELSSRYDCSVFKFEGGEIKPSFDWTRIGITDDLPAHIRLARSIDWASTSLGPIESWSTELRTMANLIMGSPQPAAMYWGPDYITIYNEAFISMAGSNHPRLLGTSISEIMGDAWSHIEANFENAWHRGQALFKQDERLFIQRGDLLEETFYNWSLVPLVGGDGSVVALYNPCFENTRRKVSERRMLTLCEIGQRTATSQTVSGYWQQLRQGLESNEFDVPFALIYSTVGGGVGCGATCGVGCGTTFDAKNKKSAFVDFAGSDASSVHSSPDLQYAGAATFPKVILEASVGVLPGYVSDMALLDLNSSSEGFAPYMRQSMTLVPTETTFSNSSIISPAPVMLTAKDGTLPQGFLASLQDQSRGFGDLCQTVVVFPVYRFAAAKSIPSQAPLAQDCAVSVAGFLVLGANPRLPYGRDSRLFVQLLAQQLTTSLATAVLFEDEIRRGEHEALRAARDRQELSHQLQLQTQQALESETKFMRMAEFTPVGMFVADSRGHITYSNDMWWSITHHPRAARLKSRGENMTRVSSTTSTVSAESGPHILGPIPLPQDAADSANVLTWTTWMESVEEEDRPGLVILWERLVRDKRQVTHEFRFKHALPLSPEAEDPASTTTTGTTWVLLRAYPEKDAETGELKSIFGCITDISQQKMAEAFQRERRQEAVERKRQQENFIDITSHEMRNPLSAMLQSVDEITNSISAFRNGGLLTERSLDTLLDSVLEASSTISLCANHQKRIVDDILTLSKLDSKLLLVTPTDVQPTKAVLNTLKMFESEFNTHGIRCTLTAQPSFRNIIGMNGWIKLDPSRLAQVLINLLTNAVKFTQACEERSIVITMGASEPESSSVDVPSDRPSTPEPSDTPDTPDTPGAAKKRRSPYMEDIDHDPDNLFGSELHFVPSKGDTMNFMESPDWGKGRKINLHLAVTDTGQGLHDEEKKILFQRFSQASPRTHVKYGGSGLGLFISKNLTELQGGQIAVKSHPGRGSTFGFYVRCRKTESPVPDTVEEDVADSSKPSQIYSFSPPTAAFSTNNSSAGIAGHECRLPVEEPAMAGSARPGFSVPSIPDSAAAVGASSSSLASYSSYSSSSSFLRPSRPAPPSPNQSTTELGHSGLDVLIVEDNIVNQKVLRRQLDNSGNRTQVANHGEEALEALRQSRFWRCGEEHDQQSTAAEAEPVEAKELLVNASILTGLDSSGENRSAIHHSDDSRRISSSSGSGGGGGSGSRTNISVILMDLEMPVMDGMTCARAIRALEKEGTLVQHVPIIAVTAYARPEQIESAKEAGVDDVISKPFRLEQLMPKIRELVDKYQMV